MLHQPFAVLIRLDLPELLQPDAELLRLASVGKMETRDELLAEIAARAFREQCVLGAQFHAAGVRVLLLSALADAHVAGRNARDRVALEQHLRRGEAGIDLDAERFRLLREPA